MIPLTTTTKNSSPTSEHAVQACLYTIQDPLKDLPKEKLVAEQLHVQCQLECNARTSNSQ